MPIPESVPLGQMVCVVPSSARNHASLTQRFHTPCALTFQVVVMTFCEGFKVTDAEALAGAELDREGVMRKITESFAYQVSRFPDILLKVYPSKRIP